jgi:hypothetical protein
MDRARSFAEELSRRLQGRADWYQTRELAEALIIRILVIDGAIDEAMTRFETALKSAESMDIYPAVWLTLACADALKSGDTARVKKSIDRYASTVQTLGYDALTKRYNVLANA